MEYVKVNQIISGVVGMSLRKRLEIEDKFTDFSCFLMNMIDLDEDAGFVSLENYKLGADCFERELVEYGFSEEEIWNKCFKVAGVKDIKALHNAFKNVHWCENYNTAVVEMQDSSKFVALRL